MELILKDMTCNGCAQAVIRILSKLDPEAKVAIDLPAQRVVIVSQTEETEVRRVLNHGGFPPAS